VGPNVILASTHPWRVAERFQLTCRGSAVETLDTDPAGRQLRRQWEVLEAEGDPGAVWQ
jgi:hypothetical protein